MNTRSIDLNCDLGEGIGDEASIVPHITSANVACGFHAGNPAVMQKTVQLCLSFGVRVGAHPGFPDQQGFGRRMLHISRDEAYAITLYQIGALAAFVRAEGGVLQHVKPHGAFYHLAAADRHIADAVAEATSRIDSALVLFGPPNSELLAAASRYGLQAASEVFADRSYRADGSLAPRTDSDAELADVEAASRQALRLAQEGVVVATDGTELRLQADTLCLHGDMPGAARRAAVVREQLETAGITVKAFR